MKKLQFYLLQFTILAKLMLLHLKIDNLIMKRLT